MATVIEARRRINHDRRRVDLPHKSRNGIGLVTEDHLGVTTVLGYVRNPGPVELPGEATLQMAIMASGGLLQGAQLDRVIVTDVAGKRVVDGQIGTSVSRNPVFGFKMKGAKAGDKVVVNWVDNKGDKRTDEATVA